MTPDEYAKMIAGNPELQATDQMNEDLSAAVSGGSDAGHNVESWSVKDGLIPYEHDEQVAVKEWAESMEATEPDLWGLHAIPNGGQRHKKTAADLKAEGVKSGVPDLDLPIARGKYIGLRIEMKRRKKSLSKVDPEQVKWIDWLRAQGHMVAVCYGADEAIAVIERYLALYPGE